METNLKAIVREGIGSSESKRLRKDGNIPAVVYGLGMDPLSVSVNAREFRNALKTEAGTNVIINLEVGSDNYTALAREIQKHPFRDEYLHIDLIQIDLTQTVEADVQIEFVGIPVGVKEEGGLVQTINSSISISALPTNIPTSIELDISALNVGDNLTATDVNLPEGVELASEDDESLLVTITLPRAAVEEDSDEIGMEDEEGTDGESTEETVEEDSSDESGE